MHWGLSSREIEDLNRTLMSSLLKRYQSTSGYNGQVYLKIPDIKPFCLELGDEIRLTKNQTDLFVAAADDYYWKGRFTAHNLVVIETSLKK